MVEMQKPAVLFDTGPLQVGGRYELAPGLEAALVREGLAVRVQGPLRPPEVQAMARPPARKRRVVLETRA